MNSEAVQSFPETTGFVDVDYPVPGYRNSLYFESGFDGFGASDT